MPVLYYTIYLYIVLRIMMAHQNTMRNLSGFCICKKTNINKCVRLQRNVFWGLLHFSKGYTKVLCTRTNSWLHDSLYRRPRSSYRLLQLVWSQGGVSERLYAISDGAMNGHTSLQRLPGLSVVANQLFIARINPPLSNLIPVYTHNNQCLTIFNCIAYT